jgi:DNA-binding transcriptional ArsR family regulator
MRVDVGPVVESVFALDLFVRNGNVAVTAWRREVHRRLGQRIHAVKRLTPSSQPLRDLRWLLDNPTSAGHSQPRRRVLATLFDFCKAAVTPYSGRMRIQLELEREARGRIVITKGVESMLSTLHPKLRWCAPVLEVPDERDRDILLNGRGLLLSPSSFLASRPGVVIDADHPTLPPTLVFALLPTTTATSMLCTTVDAGGQALSALVGHTRAAALQTLADSCTTSELAQRLNISSAGASQHATILREAGLITTCRNRNTVLHTLTPLGVALLQSDLPPTLHSLASG